MLTLVLCALILDQQEASRRSNNWLPPPWAIAAMVVLGFNEFMTLLRFLQLLSVPSVSRCYLVLATDYFLIIFTFLHILECRNPLYLGVIFVGYLIIKAVWVQLDISGEFRHGAVSLSNLFVYLCTKLLVGALA